MLKGGTEGEFGVKMIQNGNVKFRIAKFSRKRKKKGSIGVVNKKGQTTTEREKSWKELISVIGLNSVCVQRTV
jgi:hypothetical protein